MVLYVDPSRFSGVRLAENTKKMLEQKVAEDKQKAAEDKLPAEEKTPAKDQPEVVNLRVLNRMILKNSFPGELSFDDSIFGLATRLPPFLPLSVSYAPDRPVQRRRSAEEGIRSQDLGLYGLLNAAACVVVFLRLGWTSVGCVF